MCKFKTGRWGAGVSNSYFGSKGKLKSICRTNGWTWTKKLNSWGVQEIFKGNVFIGHYSPQERKLYILFMK